MKFHNFRSLDDNEKLMRKYLRMKRQLKVVCLVFSYMYILVLALLYMYVQIKYVFHLQSTSMDDLEVGDYTTVIPVMNER